MKLRDQIQGLDESPEPAHTPPSCNAHRHRLPARPTADYKTRFLWSLFDLTRFEFTLSATSAVWLMIFLAFSLEPVDRQNPALLELGLGLSLLLGTVVASGLTIYGAAFNDVLDARHDRAFAPTKPIPAGRISLHRGGTLAVLSLLAALAAAVFFGKTSILLTLLAASGIAFYNLVGRFLPAIGIVTIGLLSVVMLLIPNPRLSVGWPLLLALSHTTASAALWHWLAGKRPQLSGRGGTLICVVWAFLTLMVLGLIGLRLSPDTKAVLCTIWIGPLAAFLALLGTTAWMLRHVMRSDETTRRYATRRFGALSVLWLIAYDASWLLSAQLLWQAAAILGLLFTALILGGFQRQRVQDLRK